MDMSPANALLNVLYGALLGAAWSLYLYITKTTPEEFDPCKFARTVVSGMLTGLLLSLLGIEVSQETITQYTAANSTLTILADSLIKKLIWKCRKT